MPIARRDLRAATLNGRWQRSRRTVAQMAAGILCVLMLTERWSDGFNLASWLKTIPLELLSSIALLVLGLNRGALLLAPDRQEGILPLLLITRLTGHNIVRSKLVQGLVVDLSLLLAMAPPLVIPLALAGHKGPELGLIALGCLNVLFVSMSLGLFASVLVEGNKAGGICLLLILPWLIYSTPLSIFVPQGPVAEALMLSQALNPCEPLAHVQSVMAGFRATAFWVPLLTSHAAGWCFLFLAGALLRPCTRWRASASGDRRRKKGAIRQVATWSEWRTRLLNRNPYFWLAVRDPWPTIYLWLLLAVGTGLWAWVIWLASFRKGINIVMVLVIAVASSWALTLLSSIPREAVRQFMEDRTTGALELILCTSLGVREMVRGQWLCLRRRFLLPLLLSEVLSLALAVAGYFTLGFGGMLDPEDRALWLGIWTSVILFFPITLRALCWVSMRRALIARNLPEATGVAFVQVIALPGLAVWCIYMVGLLSHAEPSPATVAFLFAVAFVAAPLFFAWRARRVVLSELRRAAAERYR